MQFLEVRFKRLSNEIVEGLDNAVGLLVRNAERCADSRHHRRPWNRLKKVADEVRLLSKGHALRNSHHGPANKQDSWSADPGLCAGATSPALSRAVGWANCHALDLDHGRVEESISVDLLETCSTTGKRRPGGLRSSFPTGRRQSETGGRRRSGWSLSVVLTQIGRQPRRVASWPVREASSG